MPKHISFSEDAEHSVSNVLSRVHEKQEAFKASLKSLERFEELLKQLRNYVSRGWPLHVLDLRQREGEFIRLQCSQGSSEIQALEAIFGAAEAQAKNLWIWYPNLLEEACRDNELPLDMSSRHPAYTFEKGFFELTIDQRGTAVLSNPERKSAEFPGDIGAVVAKVKKEHARVFRRAFDGEMFLKKIRVHYRAVLKREGKPEGSSIVIRRIASRITSERKGYLIDQFILDLSRLAIQGPLEIEGKRLELEHTRDSKRGVLLYGFNIQGYVGFVRFREVNP